MSSGIFGSSHCSAGNHGPKGIHEVIFSAGVEGLIKVIELGFLPCPVCKPHKECGFWEDAGKSIQEKYRPEGICSLEDFETLPFDARRVAWEEIVPLVGIPTRLYLPKGGVWLDDLLELKKRFEKLEVALPQVGYYDKTAPGRFVEYVMRSL